MAMLNIRLDETTKTELQAIAKFKGESLSSLALKAINEMLENEFDYQLAQQVLANRKPKQKNYPIEDLFDEYGIK